MPSERTGRVKENYDWKVCSNEAKQSASLLFMRESVKRISSSRRVNVAFAL